MKHIKSFWQINEEFRRGQKLRGHIFESENVTLFGSNPGLINYNEIYKALDELKGAWFELKEPIESIESRHRSTSDPSINYIDASSDDLGNKIITLVEKMKRICKENGLDKSPYDEIYYSVNDILSVLPHNYEKVGMTDNKNKLSRDDRDSFSIGYKAYEKLAHLIQKYKTPINQRKDIIDVNPYHNIYRDGSGR